MRFLPNILRSVLISFALAANLVHAETVLWSDNFETNAGSRWTTNSVWKIGSPTVGPALNVAGFRTYSSTNCATTGLKGNAPANADARFICTNYNGSNFLAIPASQFPRLRFWQWFNFVNAGGWVEIQEAGATNWQAISSTNLSVGSSAISSGGVWSRPSIDLRSFAGENIQIAFHFFSGAGGYGNDYGWYLDDMALVTNQPVLNNPENFESGLGDWAVDNGTWQVGQPTSGPNQAHSGTNCAGTILAGNYGWNMNSRLISPPFLVPASGHPSLRFWQWYNFVNALGFVEINNGTNSFTIATNSISLTNSVISTNTIITTNGFILTTNNIFTTNTTITVTNSISVSENSSWQTISATNISVGSSAVSSGGWKTNAIDLSAYAGQTVEVAFHFQSGASGYGNAAGWYVDDVSLTAAPVLIVPTNSISIYPGNTLTVTNYATLTAGGAPTFILSSNAPNNAALNATSGVFTWTPTTAQIGTSTITIAVTDTNGLSATNSFTVQVLPSISLTVPANQNIYAGQTLTVTNTATNSAAATAAFNYGLISAIANISLNPTNGILIWTPASAEAGTNIISIAATQTTNTNPPVPAITNSFAVQVLLPPPPVLNVSANTQLTTTGFQFGFTGTNGILWLIDVSTNLSDWTLLTNATVSNNLAQVSDPAATNYPRRFYRAVLP
jgi:Putative Ig domain